MHVLHIFEARAISSKPQCALGLNVVAADRHEGGAADGYSLDQAVLSQRRDWSAVALQLCTARATEIPDYDLLVDAAADEQRSSYANLCDQKTWGLRL